MTHWSKYEALIGGCFGYCAVIGGRAGCSVLCFIWRIATQRTVWKLTVSVNVAEECMKHIRTSCSYTRLQYLCKGAGGGGGHIRTSCSYTRLQYLCKGAGGGGGGHIRTSCSYTRLQFQVKGAGGH